MSRRRLALSLAAILSLLSPAATWQQPGEAFGVPWWAWLVVIVALLLIAFVIIVAFDWSSARSQEEDEE